jgi:hypothetical protein
LRGKSLLDVLEIPFHNDLMLEGGGGGEGKNVIFIGVNLQIPEPKINNRLSVPIPKRKLYRFPYFAKLIKI